MKQIILEYGTATCTDKIELYSDKLKKGDKVLYHKFMSLEGETLYPKFEIVYPEECIESKFLRRVFISFEEEDYVSLGP